MAKYYTLTQTPREAVVYRPADGGLVAGTFPWDCHDRSR